MTPDNTRRSVLLIGKSQRVLDESVAGLRDLGYKAEATNDFADVTARFLDGRLGGGDHAIPVPDLVPPRAAFATVQIDAAIYAFSIATEQ